VIIPAFLVAPLVWLLGLLILATKPTKIKHWDIIKDSQGNKETWEGEDVPEVRAIRFWEKVVASMHLPVWFFVFFELQDYTEKRALNSYISGWDEVLFFYSMILFFALIGLSYVGIFYANKTKV
jgi:hypothetical protein